MQEFSKREIILERGDERMDLGHTVHSKPLEGNDRLTYIPRNGSSTWYHCC